MRLLTQLLLWLRVPEEMIDTTKTVGTAATFDPDRIHALLSQGAINNISNLEKAIFSLEYLG